MWSIIFLCDVFLNALRSRVLRKISLHQLNHIKLSGLSMIGCWKQEVKSGGCIEGPEDVKKSILDD